MQVSWPEHEGERVNDAPLGSSSGSVGSSKISQPKYVPPSGEPVAISLAALPGDVSSIVVSDTDGVGGLFAFPVGGGCGVEISNQPDFRIPTPGFDRIT